MSETDITIESILMSNFLNFMLSNINMPDGFHAQASSIKTMLNDDISGLVDSLSDFMVSSASVGFTIETNNDKLTATLKKWLAKVNFGYNGLIPIGINELAKEYFRERWKMASFPVLKIAKWENFDGLRLPTKMFFVDGGSIYAYDKKESKEIQLLNYDYYLGQKNSSETNKLDRNVIFSKPGCRWFDKYPVPFLIRRGIYHNFKIIESIKQQEERTLSRVIPYLLHITKGGDLKNMVKTYSDPQLKEISDQFKQLTKDIAQNSGAGIRTSNFDENIKHLIPDLTDLFKPLLFESAEKNILSGFGYINLAEALSSSNKGAILNPKGFIEEVKDGVDGFKQILNQVTYRIQDENKDDHTKYMNSIFHIISSPVKGFMTDEFKRLVRVMYDRGRISSQTAVELVCEVDFETEVMRREREDREGVQKKMYPVITQNQEQQTYQKDELDTLDRVVPDDKIDVVEKQEYKNAIVHTSEIPYANVEALPTRVTNNMPVELQAIWLDAVNGAYDKFADEVIANKVAWKTLKTIAKKDKNKKWVKISDKQITLAEIDDIIKRYKPNK